MATTVILAPSWRIAADAGSRQIFCITTDGAGSKAKDKHMAGLVGCRRGYETGMELGLMKIEGVDDHFFNFAAGAFDWITQNHYGKATIFDRIRQKGIDVGYIAVGQRIGDAACKQHR